MTKNVDSISQSSHQTKLYLLPKQRQGQNKTVQELKTKYEEHQQLLKQVKLILQDKSKVEIIQQQAKCDQIITLLVMEGIAQHNEDTSAMTQYHEAQGIS